LWIRNNPTESDRKAAQSGGLKIAGSNPSGKKEDDGVEVVLTMDKDEATRRRERDAEAAAKREQNAMPQWYLTSTISGDATALGIAEQKRAAQYAAEQASLASSSNSNDAILKGLGTVGITRTSETSHIIEDIKPNVDEGPDCKSKSLRYYKLFSRTG
jgi:transcription initiation factor TFIIE subunit alpha